MNVAVVAFAATVTFAGTVATVGLLLVSATTAPPAGAGPFNVIVPDEELPPVTELRVTLTELSVAAVTVTLSVLVIPPYDPEIVTDVFAATGKVVTVNVAVVAPAATVTLAGTVATAVLLLVSATTAPPAGAAPFNVTVACEVPPPRTELALTLTELSVPAVTVRLSVLVTPL